MSFWTLRYQTFKGIAQNIGIGTSDGILDIFNPKFGWLRSWIEKAMERKLDRLVKESRELQKEIELQTGKPIELN